MARGTVVQKIIEAHFVEGSRETGKPVAIRIDHRKVFEGSYDTANFQS